MNDKQDGTPDIGDTVRLNEIGDHALGTVQYIDYLESPPQVWVVWDNFCPTWHSIDTLCKVF